jgi:hypothetical protein
MAHLFDDSLSEYLTSPMTVPAIPIGIACWFQTDDLAVNGTLVSLSNSADSQQYFSMRSNGPGASIEFAARAGAGSEATANTSAVTLTANNWFLATAYALQAGNRLVAINQSGDGVFGGSLATRTPSGLDTVQIGALNGSQFHSGRIAQVVVWGLTLSESAAPLEEENLWNGGRSVIVSPPAYYYKQHQVRGYWALLNNDGDTDWRGLNNLTQVTNRGNTHLTIGRRRVARRPARSGLRSSRLELPSRRAISATFVQGQIPYADHPPLMIHYDNRRGPISVVVEVGHPAIRRMSLTRHIASHNPIGLEGVRIA